MLDSIFLFIEKNQILSGSAVVFIPLLAWGGNLIMKKSKIEVEQGPVTKLGKHKSDYKILFIDDQPFRIVDILKKNGWTSTKRIKDVANLDDDEVKESSVLFVDINGVGKTLNFKDEGLGLASEIKRKYPSKRVVLYSAEQHRFHPALSQVDKCLYKNADQYEFEKIIEDFFNKES
jgi:hypothetical protein